MQEPNWVLDQTFWPWPLQELHVSVLYGFFGLMEVSDDPVSNAVQHLPFFSKQLFEFRIEFVVVEYRCHICSLTDITFEVVKSLQKFCKPLLNV